jgi:hypothetical protein
MTKGAQVYVYLGRAGQVGDAIIPQVNPPTPWGVTSARFTTSGNAFSLARPSLYACGVMQHTGAQHSIRSGDTPALMVCTALDLLTLGIFLSRHRYSAKELGVLSMEGEKTAAATPSHHGRMCTGLR